MGGPLRPTLLRCTTLPASAAPQYGSRPDTPALATLPSPAHFRSALGGNHFTGDLPDEWAVPGAFPALQTLELSWSRLNGSLPRRC